MSAPDFLAIGHICCDLVDGRRILGGSASYASLTARALGRKVGIITSVSDQFPFLNAFRDIAIENVPSADTTTFTNIYRNGVREQIISSVAAPIKASDISDAWASAEIVYLCPVADEVMPAVVERFPNSLLGVGAQGWFREWNKSGRVRKKRWRDAALVASNVDAVIFSELDTEKPYSLAEELARLCPMVIVTRSYRGAELFIDRQRIHAPAYEIKEVDPTGAGDVFAAAFLIRYKFAGDPIDSVKFACCAASFVCESEGTRGIPTLDQVLARLERYNIIFR